MKHGLKPLSCLSKKLSDIVAKHVDYQIDTDAINHNGFSERCDATGANSCAENTLYNNDGDAKKSTQQWMESPGHRENILKEKMNQIGFAAKKAPNGKWFVTAILTEDNSPCDTIVAPSPGPPSDGQAEEPSDETEIRPVTTSAVTKPKDAAIIATMKSVNLTHGRNVSNSQNISAKRKPEITESSPLPTVMPFVPSTGASSLQMETISVVCRLFAGLLVFLVVGA